MQLLGFSDVVTGAIGVCTSVGAAVGFLVGGGAGDYFSIRFPNAARPAINQLSMVFSTPLYVAFLKGLPGLAESHSLPLAFLVWQHLNHACHDERPDGQGRFSASLAKHTCSLHADMLKSTTRW